MQKKIEYPKNGIIQPFISSPLHHPEKYRARAYLQGCDQCKVTLGRDGRVPFYGYETIGPRVYALYRCTIHGMKKVRLKMYI